MSASCTLTPFPALSQIDPSGHFFIGLIVALVSSIIGIVGAVIATIAAFIAYLAALAAQFVVTVVGAVGNAFGAMGSALMTAAKAGVAKVVAGITIKKVLIGAALSAVYSGAQTAINGGSFSDILKAAAIGAVTGAVGAVTGGFLHGFGGAIGGALTKAGMSKMGGMVAGKIIHAAAHGVVGGAMSAAQGGSFKDGFIGSAIGAGVSAVSGSIPGLDALEGDGALKIIARTAVASISGGAASALAGGKFADGAYSAAFFHLFNAEFEFVFNNKTYTGFKSDTATLEASLGGSYQMEKNGKYLGHCHAEVQHFTDAPNSDTLLGGMPTLAELVDAGVELDAVAFSTFSKPDGTRYNGRSTSGGYDHSVMVSVRREQVTMKPNFFRRIFGAKPIIQTVTKVDIYENYHVNGNPETPLGLTPRRNINYATYAEGTGSVPLRLATNRPPR